MGNLRLRDSSSWIMFAFGAMAVLLGLLGLMRPELLLTILGFAVIDQTVRPTGDYTLVFIIAASMASFNIGAYYILAALRGLRVFYLWTVPFRLLTFTVFTYTALSGLAPMRFIAVGGWEGLGAISTGLALYFDSRKTEQK